ncbi:MAG: hypothetical protein ACLQU4_04230 [Limisphaerales bacterium]
MKLQSSQSHALRGWRAFTLVEAMVVSVTLIVIIGSLMMCNLFGLAMSVRQQIWLGASDDAAQAIGMLSVDIRQANSLKVGTYTSNVFAATAGTNLQTGNALEIFSTTNTNVASGPWTIYYYDPTSNNLVRTNFYSAATNGDYKLVSANPITNDVNHPIFSEVNYLGATYTNANYVPPYPSINIYLSFSKLQNPQINIESGSLIDLYQIITTISPRLGL